MRAIGLVLWVAACGGGGNAGSADAAGPMTDANTTPPPTTCTEPVAPVDVSHPTTVVGDGSAASCPETALGAAIAKGGVVTFACGAAPATITVTAAIDVKTDTTIDGGGVVTLSGGGASRILHIASA